MRWLDTAAVILFAIGAALALGVVQPFPPPACSYTQMLQCVSSTVLLSGNHNILAGYGSMVLAIILEAVEKR